MPALAVRHAARSSMQSPSATCGDPLIFEDMGIAEGVTFPRFNINKILDDMITLFIRISRST